MNRTQILEILNDWNFWKKEINTGIKRYAEISRVESLSKIGEIVVVSGVRRCGKSTILLQFCEALMDEGVKKEDILIVNFEDPRFKDLNLDLLNNIYEVYLSELNPSKKHYVILDEIQAIDGWEKFARFLHENKKISVFVTGSSSKLLSSEYSTVLAGRHVDMETFPLSFSEFAGFKGIKIKNALDIAAERHKLKGAFSEYLKWGGFPKAALLASEDEKKELLRAYFSDIIVKDIVSRYNIKETEKVESLAKYYISNTATLQSFNRIKDALQMNIDTVVRFSNYLESVYLLFFVKKFAYSLKEQEQNPRKVYCIDNSFRNAVGFVFSGDFGRLAENTVFIELMRRGEDAYYWKDGAQREVDFVLKRGTKISEAIQVCWNLEDAATKKREIDALLSAMSEFGLKQGTVITEGFEDEEKIARGKIIYMPLWKWLLARETGKKGR